VADSIVIGRIRSAFGRAGEIKVESLSGELHHFTVLKSVLVRLRGAEATYAIESVRLSNRVVLMKLQGIDTIEQAAGLRDGELVVPRARASGLGPDEFYYADLVGLTVIAGGDTVGVVKAIVETGARPLLEIDTQRGASVLVPFHRHFVGEIEMDARTIEIVEPMVFE
jgi:16S rRNA processing protein RimM